MNISAAILKLFWKNVERKDIKRLKTLSPTEGIDEIIDIDYYGDGERGHLLDIYYPHGGEEKLPVIIDIHGGGWMYGYKENNKFYCHKLASKGFVVVSLNYRLADKVFFNDQINDLFKAFEWIESNLSKYHHADMGNVFIVGDSAGGHLAAVCAAVNINDEYAADFGVKRADFDFKAVGMVSPAVDLTMNDITMKMNLKMLLGDNYKKNKLYKYMNYDKIASYKLPPFYITTSDGDFIQYQSYRLSCILTKYHVYHKLDNYSDYLFGKKLDHEFSVGHPDAPPSRKAIAKMTDYFKTLITE